MHSFGGRCWPHKECGYPLKTYLIYQLHINITLSSWFNTYLLEMIFLRKYQLAVVRHRYREGLIILTLKYIQALISRGLILPNILECNEINNNIKIFIFKEEEDSNFKALVLTIVKLINSKNIPRKIQLNLKFLQICQICVFL